MFVVSKVLIEQMLCSLLTLPRCYHFGCDICFSVYMFAFIWSLFEFINLKFISTSASHMMLQNFGLICQWIFELLIHFHVSKGDLKPIRFRNLFLPRLSHYRTLMIPFGDNLIMFYDFLISVLQFGWCALEYVKSEI